MSGSRYISRFISPPICCIWAIMNLSRAAGASALLCLLLGCSRTKRPPEAKPPPPEHKTAASKQTAVDKEKTALALVKASNAFSALAAESPTSIVPSVPAIEPKSSNATLALRPPQLSNATPVTTTAKEIPTTPGREELSLVARWSFQNVNVDLAGDDSGIFLAELRGAQVAASPEGKVLRFTGDSQGVRLPQVLLNKRSAGVISLWFRQDDPKVLARIMTRATRGAAPELSIEVAPDGKINFTISGQRVTSQQQLEAGKFYHLAFVWNDEGQKIFVDGKLDAHATQPAAIGLAARLTEMGRDPNKPGTTGSRMTIRDLRFYKGYIADADISSLAQ